MFRTLSLRRSFETSFRKADGEPGVVSQERKLLGAYVSAQHLMFSFALSPGFVSRWSALGTPRFIISFFEPGLMCTRLTGSYGVYQGVFSMKLVYLRSRPFIFCRLLHQVLHDTGKPLSNIVGHHR